MIGVPSDIEVFCSFCQFYPLDHNDAISVETNLIIPTYVQFAQLIDLIHKSHYAPV